MQPSNPDAPSGMRQSERLLVNLFATSTRFGAEFVIGVLLTPILIWQLGFEVFGFLMTIGASGLLLSMIMQSMQQSIARELGFSIGAADVDRLTRTFSTAFFLQLAGSVLFCSAAIAASPLIVRVLTIPDGYENVALIALVLTILQLGYGIALSPFGGLMRAHQDLQTVALLQFLLKASALVAGVAMSMWDGNKLLFYVAALLVLSLPINSAYAVIALRRYAEARPHASLVSRTAARALMQFGAFSLLSLLGFHLRRNGLTVLLNIFYGNVASSASGIAARVSGLLLHILNLVTTVVLPAMATSMGAKRIAAAERLIRIASATVLAIGIPVAVTVMTNAEPILETWLRTEVPELAVLIVQLVVMSLTLSLVSVGHGLAQRGRGDIGVLVTVSELLIVASITIASVVAIRQSLPPWWLFAGELVGVFLAFCLWQPFWVTRRLQLKSQEWIRKTLMPAGIVLLLCLLVAHLAAELLPAGILRAAAVAAGTICVSSLVMWAGSLRPDERAEVFRILDRRRQSMRRRRG